MTTEKLRRSPTEKTPRETLLLAFEKACAVAAEKREVHKDLRQEYRGDRKKRERMQALLIKDLLRVFNSPLNPYAGWAASRTRYRSLGHYPEIMVAW